jgi:hypothetical protein
LASAGLIFGGAALWARAKGNKPVIKIVTMSVFIVVVFSK